MEYKCLSIKQPFADLIRKGEKTIEMRTWRTRYRGDLLIVSSVSPKIPGPDGPLPTGKAVCMVDLFEIEPFSPKHLKSACIKKNEIPEKAVFAWKLRNIRPIPEPLPAIKGRLGIYSAWFDFSII